jgi:hypothetical protein
MFKTTSHTSRHRRPDPYIFDGMFVAFHRSAAGVAWRWRVELALLTTTTAALWRLALWITLLWAAVVLAAFVVILLALPATRRFTARRFWCVLSRHRLQRVCYETRLHTRSGRLPLILWIRPTETGERAYVLCRAGICADDFDQHKGEITAACYAREARVSRNPRWGQLVTIDIMRRDLLHHKRIITADIAPARTQTRSELSA